MTQQELLCTVDLPLVDHVRELLSAAGIESRAEQRADGRADVMVPPASTEHARSVIGIVLPHLLDDPPGAARLSDRLIRTESDPPALPGGLVDARATYGYADPLADADEIADDPDDAEDFVPPEPPPLPRPRDRIEKASWLGLILGPLLLVAVQVFGLPGILTPVALVAFLGGFVGLIARMEDRPGRDDGWDDGAVV